MASMKDGKTIEGFMLTMLKKLDVKPREDTGEDIVFLNGDLCQQTLRRAMDLQVKTDKKPFMVYYKNQIMPKYYLLHGRLRQLANG